MEEVQRTRILEAMAEAMSDRGAGGATVTLADVIERAGVSSGAFHEAFVDREACLLAAFDLGVQRARMRLSAAYDAEPRWIDAVKAGLAEFLRFLEDEPALGRLLVVYSMSGGEQVLRRRVEILEALAAVVDRGRLEGPAGRQAPPPSSPRALSVLSSPSCTIGCCPTSTAPRSSCSARSSASSCCPTSAWGSLAGSSPAQRRRPAAPSHADLGARTARSRIAPPCGSPTAPGASSVRSPTIRGRATARSPTAPGSSIKGRSQSSSRVCRRPR